MDPLHLHLLQLFKDISQALSGKDDYNNNNDTNYLSAVLQLVCEKL